MTDRPAAQLDKQAIELTVNGKPVRVETDAAKPLLYVLRDELALRGSRFGCGLEQCGSCMVLIDGAAEPSCSREVGSLAGKSIVTIEGLSKDGQLSVLQKMFLEEQAGQCGFCLSGILISATALLANNPKPTRAQITEALDRNLCRCGMHNRVIRAIQRAGEAMPKRQPGMPA